MTLRRTRAPVRREQTGDAALDRMQRSAQEQARFNALVPFLVGRLVSVQLVAGTAKVINHGLGSVAAFIVARHNYDGTGTQTRLPVESATAFQTALDTKNQISIVCADSGTWDIWFYPAGSKTLNSSGVGY